MVYDSDLRHPYRRIARVDHGRISEESDDLPAWWRSLRWVRRGDLEKKKPTAFTVGFAGSPGRIRTSDQMINSHLLYH